ncbi:MAG: lasso peptide biosynthesis B2 protein [Bacteroidales bacterium]|nr:lasso peptide biosynthesis B2 protein [Bacteroidales bacterium]
MFKLLRKYYSIDKTERKILNRTFFWLIYAFILVRIVPLKWFSHLLGEFKNEVVVEINSGQKGLIQMLRKNIRRWKRYLPWKVKCFEEAIAGKKVLAKYKIGSTLYLGVDKNTNKELIAHAWLKAGNEIIIGKKGFEKFVVVGFYS